MGVSYTKLTNYVTQKELNDLKGQNVTLIFKPYKEQYLKTNNTVLNFTNSTCSVPHITTQIRKAGYFQIQQPFCFLTGTPLSVDGWYQFSIDSAESNDAIKVDGKLYDIILTQITIPVSGYCSTTKTIYRLSLHINGHLYSFETTQNILRHQPHINPCIVDSYQTIE